MEEGPEPPSERSAISALFRSFYLVQLAQSESSQRPPQEQPLVLLRGYDKVNLDLVRAHRVRWRVSA
jgi:hypothetical protein